MSCRVPTKKMTAPLNWSKEKTRRDNRIFGLPFCGDSQKNVGAMREELLCPNVSKWVNQKWTNMMDEDWLGRPQTSKTEGNRT